MATPAPVEPVEAVIILGAVVGQDGYPGRVARLRLQHALPLVLEAYPESPVIISGGIRPGCRLSEARAMADWLLEQAEGRYGVAKARELQLRLCLEEHSRNTAASAHHTARILLGQQRRGAGLVTDTLHMPRAHYLFRRVFEPQGLYCLPLPAPGLWQDYWRRRRYLRLSKFILREAAAWVKLWGLELAGRR